MEGKIQSAREGLWYLVYPVRFRNESLGAPVAKGNEGRGESPFFLKLTSVTEQNAHLAKRAHRFLDQSVGRSYLPNGHGGGHLRVQR